jgi:hypothetical protein
MYIFHLINVDEALIIKDRCIGSHVNLKLSVLCWKYFWKGELPRLIITHLRKGTWTLLIEFTFAMLKLFFYQILYLIIVFTFGNVGYDIKQSLKSRNFTIPNLYNLTWEINIESVQKVRTNDEL